jgi:hypothetical protein
MRRFVLNSRTPRQLYRAEREGVDTLFTLDQRDFSAYLGAQASLPHFA